MPANSIAFILAVFGVVASVAACSTSDPPPASNDPSNPGTFEPGTSSGGESSSGTPGSSGSEPPSGGTKLPEGWGKDQCVAPATKVGFGVGDTIDDLGIIDCDTGAAVSIDEVCGASATWIFAAHTHCPTCQATAGFTDDIAKEVAEKNVAIVQLVYDDNGTSCAKWRSVYKLSGIPNVRVYEDPNGAAYAKLAAENYTAASVFLDRKRVITHKEHSLGKAAILSQIEAALAKP